MDDQKEPVLAKWPFFLADAVLLGTAAYLGLGAGAGASQLTLAVVCLIAGAVIGVAPFLLEYRAAVRLAESKGLSTVLSTIQNLETIAGQIGGATGHWQEVQQSAEKTVRTAREAAERMAAEVKGFSEFMERINDREKQTLRVEVEKLRRSELEWLQVLIRMLDHVYALHIGAVRSSQPTLIDQVGHFQNACHEAARRVGLTSFTAGKMERFDGARHQLPDGEPKAEDGATVSETIAAGYTFQGRLVRPALVKLTNGNG